MPGTPIHTEVYILLIVCELLLATDCTTYEICQETLGVIRYILHILPGRYIIRQANM